MEIPKTCFIENDFDVDDDLKDYIVSSIWRATDIELDFNKLFDVIITNAHQKELDVWSAISKCEYIFISTSFCGYSAGLLEDMCKLALKQRIKNKYIINFRDSDSPIHATYNGIRMLKIIQARNNVKYITQDSVEFEIITKQLFATQNEN